MKKTLIIALSAILIATILYSFYSHGSVKNNKVYTAEDSESTKDIVKIDSDIKDRGKNNFFDISRYTSKLKQGEIFITVSKDKNTIFYMIPSFLTPSTYKENKAVVLKGRTSQTVNLYAKDLSTDDITVIALNIPFITSYGLNKEGNLAFFKGEEYLLLYNIRDKKSLMEKELAKVKVDAASWSRDGKKLYLQYYNIPNGAVIYTDTLKLVEAYELPDEIFYKDAFNEDSYFGVIQNLNSSNTLLSNCSSAIINNQGERLKDLGNGIYADSFEKSVLLKNLNNTYSYIINFTSSKNPIKLSEKLVYDAGFLYDGSLFYITEADDSLRNMFILHRVNKYGNEVDSFEISGSSLLLLPDGKQAYVNGPDLEFVNFENNSMSAYGSLSPIDSEIISNLYSALKNFKTNAIEGKSIKVSPFFTEAAANTLDTLLADLKGSLSESFISLYLSSNPEGRAVITNFNQINDFSAEMELLITVRTYWTIDFKETYKIAIIKDKNHWKVSSFHIK